MAIPRNSKTTVFSALQLDGSATATINSIAITELLVDGNGDLVICSGLTIPTDGSSGYAKGGIFLKTDVATGTGGTYLNKGTRTSSVFSLVTQA